jgi:hypothetical protein
MMLSASSTEGAVSETVLDPAVAVVLIMVVYLVLLMVCVGKSRKVEGRKRRSPRRISGTNGRVAHIQAIDSAFIMAARLELETLERFGLVAFGAGTSSNSGARVSADTTGAWLLWPVMMRAAR